MQLRLFVFTCMAVLGGAAQAGSGAPILRQENLYQPQQVAAWLRQHRATADRSLAASFYSAGVQARESGRWSAAGKAFGESALRYPDAHTLLEYAHATVRSHPRGREVLATLYRSALASDSVVPTLSKEERARVAATLAPPPAR